jgi:hypothetical protein
MPKKPGATAPEPILPGHVRVDLVTSLSDKTYPMVTSEGSGILVDTGAQLSIARGAECEDYCAELHTRIKDSLKNAGSVVTEGPAPEEPAEAPKDKKKVKEEPTPASTLRLTLLRLDVEETSRATKTEVRVSTTDKTGHPEKADLHPATRDGVTRFSLRHSVRSSCAEVEQARLHLVLEEAGRPARSITVAADAPAQDISQESFFFEVHERRFTVVDPPADLAKKQEEATAGSCSLVAFEDIEPVLTQLADRAVSAMKGAKQ